MLQDETPLRNKKKKSLMSPLSDKMGLDTSTDMVAPSPRPASPMDESGLLGGSPEASLNQSQNRTVLGKVEDRLRKRKKGMPNE